jgi:DNA polymerase-3 subunit alpha
MTLMPFVHLRAHTEFSVVDGTLRIDDAVAAAAADGQVAFAVTDLSNMFGAVKFYSAARKAGIKPILGCELVLEGEKGEAGGGRVAVLVQDRRGYATFACCFRRRGSRTPREATRRSSGPGSRS